MKAKDIRRRYRSWLQLGAVLVALLIGTGVLAACGGGSSSSATSTVAADPSAQFLGPNQKNKLVEFGTEASAGERSAASAILQKSFKAREAADFVEQCGTLSKKAANRIGLSRRLEAGRAGKSKCAHELKIIAEPLAHTAPFRKDKLSGEIAAMRVKGDRGFALFHGTDGKDWVIPLEKEAGIWKVAAILEEEIHPESAEPGKEPAKPSASKSSNSTR